MARPTTAPKSDRLDSASRDQVLVEIARRLLHFDTLETRRMDELDFRDVAVWSVKEALEAAYAAGRASAVR